MSWDDIDDDNYSDGMTPPHYNAGNAGWIPLDDDRNFDSYCTCGCQCEQKVEDEGRCEDCRKGNHVEAC